jgi:hypothetical protein
MTLQSLVALTLLSATTVFAGSADEIARAAEERARVALPLRGDVSVAIDGVEGKRDQRMILLQRKAANGVDTFVSLETAGLRYLVLADGSAYVAEKGKTRKVGLDTAIDGTSWLLEDLRPFTVERCGVARNVDESPQQVTILCNPLKGETGIYALTTYKFDREKVLPKRVMYYQERQDNLVKMLRIEERTAVGEKWLPARMTMENFKLRTKDVFEIRWAEVPDLGGEPFDPKTFATATLPNAGEPHPRSP